MITQALYNKLHTLATKQRFTKQDAEELQAAIRQTINPRYSVCLKCIQQLKHGQRLILNYLNSVEVIENIPPVVETVLLDSSTLEPIVDEVEADKVGCTKCSRKKKTKM
jgi:short-subunit dehydrogenase involved in D-alanine esterification of teichoic acids